MNNLQLPMILSVYYIFEQLSGAIAGHRIRDSDGDVFLATIDAVRVCSSSRLGPFNSGRWFPAAQLPGHGECLAWHLERIGSVAGPG